MRALLIAMALCAGMLIPVQTAINAQLRAMLFQSPVLASLISFAVGTVALALLYFGVQRGAMPDAGMLARTSWWMWLGGLLGAFFICTGVVAAPRLGIALVIILLVAGQLTMALVLDHFGLIGLPVRPVTAWRLAGVALALLGAWMFARG